MAKQQPPVSILPPTTKVELVGTKGTKAVKKETTLEDATTEKKKLENDPKWRGWYFQIYQLGFSSHKTEK